MIDKFLDPYTHTALHLINPHITKITRKEQNQRNKSKISTKEDIARFR
jgi:hypothetical protein